MAESFRTRNWVSILYPESAVDNWLEVLRDQHIPAFVSPLHDRDVSADGQPKKPHHHVVLMFASMKTEKQAQAVFDLIGAIKCQSVNDIRGTSRYLCHMDDYNKAQYDSDDVICCCGADYLEKISLSSDKYSAIREMRDFVQQNGCIYFSDLFDYASEYRPMWFRSLCDNSSFVMEKYIKSLAYKLEMENRDPER